MRLEEIQNPVRKMLDETSSILSSSVKSDISIINHIRSLVPVSKGKKIRSTLLFLLSGASRHSSPDLPIVASSIELLHLSSLIHDDILDRAEQRRGEKTLNHAMGNLVSVLGGDLLFTKALELMNSLNNRRLMEILLGSTGIMVEGQLQEIENNFNKQVGLGTYLDIIKKKTSSLFSAVSRMTAVLCGMDRETENRFHEFGLNFGSIFQISDDLIDIFSSSSGKDRFRDLQEGKITLPFIMLREATGGEAARYFSAGNSAILLDLFEQYNIRKKCDEKVEEYHVQCKHFISGFPPSAHTESLVKLLDFIRIREY